MPNKKTIVVVFATIICGILTANYAVANKNENESTEMSYLDQIRQQSLLEGSIYDDDLLRFDLIQSRVDNFGGLEAANEFYNDFNQLLEESKGNPGMEITNKGTMRQFNFGALVGDVVRPYEVAALVIDTQMAEGTYITPVKPLRILHEWMLDEYDVHPDMASSRLDRLVGDMRPLALEILKIKETEALLDRVPMELKDADPTYWAVVGDYGHCTIVEERADCAQYLAEAEARAWEEPDPKDFHHVDPPGEVWPPAGFLIPKAR